MIGIFDSGVGGMCALREVRALLPRSDIIYLADRKNAPYGTKTEEVLRRLVRQDIKRLREMGAEKILVACCTASSVLSSLDNDERTNVFPIIIPAAKVAASLRRVTVIATDHTIASSAFGKAIKRFSEDTEVQEIPCQRLVSLVEQGSRDGCITKECKGILTEVARITKEHSSEGLILGCTHFSHLENSIQRLLPKIKIINPAKIGAQTLAKPMTVCRGAGRTIYTE